MKFFKFSTFYLALILMVVLCSRAYSEESFDAVCVVKDPNVKYFFFKGKKYWKVSHNIVARGYPKSITEWGFSSNDGNFDAVCGLHDSYNKFFFFKGKRYWKVVNDHIESGYPKNITEWGFPPGEGDFDAVCAIELNTNIFYFFKGNRYWKVVNDHIEKGYPKNINQWGLYSKGGDFDAVCSVEGSPNKYSFFKGDQYWVVERNQVVNQERRITDIDTFNVYLDLLKPLLTKRIQKTLKDRGFDPIKASGSKKILRSTFYWTEAIEGLSSVNVDSITINPNGRWDMEMSIKSGLKAYLNVHGKIAYIPQKCTWSVTFNNFKIHANGSYSTYSDGRRCIKNLKISHVKTDFGITVNECDNVVFNAFANEITKLFKNTIRDQVNNNFNGGMNNVINYVIKDLSLCE